MSAILGAASNEAEFAAARALFEEYARQLGIDLGFQNFPEELERLPQMYGPPTGCLLLASSGQTFDGCGAIRRWNPQTCEMKRLYVRPAARGAALGRRLAAGLIDRASALGYSRMVLDTLGDMHAARALYRSLGFRETAAYYPNPVPGVVYMDLDLTARRADPAAP